MHSSTPMSLSEYRRERASYRYSYPLEYPAELIPRVVIEPGTAAVLEDWSETGMRIRVTATTQIAIGDTVRLTVTPQSSDELTLEGLVARVDGASISVRLKPPALPAAFMVAEHGAIRAWQATTALVSEEMEAKQRNSLRTIDELS